MRIGWIVANDDVTQKVVYLKQAADLHTNELAQRMVCKYFQSSSLEKHLREINNIYREKRDLTLRLIQNYFSASIFYTKPNGGILPGLHCPTTVTVWKSLTALIAKKR